MGAQHSRHLFLLASMILSLGACSPKSQPGSVWSAPAPTSKKDTGLIVLSERPIQPQLENLMLAKGGQGRVLSADHNLFEIKGVSAEELQALGPDVVVEKNVYIPNIVSQAQTRSFPDLLKDAPVADDPMQKLRDAGFQPCVEDPEGPTAVVTSDVDLTSGVTDKRDPITFSASKSTADPKHPGVLRLAFLIQGPSLSDIHNQIEVGDHMVLKPDLLGGYSVSLLVQDQRNVCDVADLQYIVTANPKFLGPQTPSKLAPDKIALFTQLATVEAPEAWKLTRGKGTIIAIVDTGVFYNHPDLAQNILINDKEIADNQIDDDKNGLVDDVLGWDFVNNDNAPYDDQSHGTHVAGLAASAVTGIAPEAKILAVKAMNGFGGGDIATIVAGVFYAVDRGANVINASFGSENPMMQSVKRAVDYAESKGVVFVAAAGNGDKDGNGVNNDVTPHYPSSLGNKNLVSVAALNGDSLTKYSNYGPKTVDVAAPGGEGDHPLMSTAYENPKGRYVGMSGTSMATPVTAGIVALAHSLAPTMSPADLIARMEISGRQVPTLQGKVVSGRVISAKALLANLQTHLP